MTGQTEKGQPSEDKLASAAQSTPGEGPSVEEGQTSGDQSSAGKSPNKLKLNIYQFFAGFLGWFLVTGLVYSLKIYWESQRSAEEILFVVNLGVLAFLLTRLRSAGLGMLAALSLNLVIALMLGSFLNALCFMPFYTAQY